jgi:hypothetical protein
MRGQDEVWPSAALAVEVSANLSRTRGHRSVGSISILTQAHYLRYQSPALARLITAQR